LWDLTDECKVMIYAFTRSRLTHSSVRLQTTYILGKGFRDISGSSEGGGGEGELRGGGVRLELASPR
jgi:hypothetical protein